MRMEVAGICGTDVKLYKAPPSSTPRDHGGQKPRTIAKAGREFTAESFKEATWCSSALRHVRQVQWCHWASTGIAKTPTGAITRRHPAMATRRREGPPFVGRLRAVRVPAVERVVHHVPKGVTPEAGGSGHRRWPTASNGPSLTAASATDSAVNSSRARGSRAVADRDLASRRVPRSSFVTGTFQRRARMEVAKRWAPTT